MSRPAPPRLPRRHARLPGHRAVRGSGCACSHNQDASAAERQTHSGTEGQRANGTSATPQFELVAPQVEDRSVLLLDDTFTRGRSIAAAHRALVSGGASIIGPLVIGRHFHLDFPTSVGLWSCLKDQRWSLDRCGLCGPVDCQTEPLPQAML